MRVLWRLLKYQRPYWRMLVGAYLCVIAGTALGLVVPDVVRRAVDHVVHSSSEEGLIWTLLGAGGLIVGATLLRGLFAFAQRAWAEILGQRVAYDLRNTLYDHLQRLSFEYHDQAMTGDLMLRLTSDVEAVRMLIGMALPELTATLVLVLFVAVQLLLLSVDLALWALLLVPVMLLVAALFGVRQRAFFFRAQQLFGKMVTVLQENLAGVRVVRAFAREPFEEHKFDSASAAYRRQRLLAVGRWAVFVPLVVFLSSMTLVVTLAVGGPMVARGELSVGTLTAFTIYLSMLAIPMRMLGFVINMLARGSASGTRLFEVLDARSAVVERPDARDLPAVRGEVAFENVSFAYTHAVDQPVVEDVSFVAEPGQVIALLGATGAGRSTIVNLIPRFYDPTAGRVLVDGFDLRDITLRSLRRQVGMVLQESFLFSTTVAENIAYGTPDASQQAIESAARAAQAHDFIMELPDGYQTRMGERGVTLSGGQRQRIAIARALLRDPRILLLDDATASVDTETEYAIQQALQTLMQGRTTFVIAHRLATLRKANLILVLEDGRIVQRGTHAELLEQPGLYRRIYELYASEQATLSTL